jgi:hypothetical protein
VNDNADEDEDVSTVLSSQPPTKPMNWSHRLHDKVVDYMRSENRRAAMMIEDLEQATLTTDCKGIPIKVLMCR